jgi:hypothetical protein
MPFPLLHVPLDDELFDGFSAKAQQSEREERARKGEKGVYFAESSFHVLDLPKMRSRFGPAESAFRESKYNEMALAKWELAAGFQEAGYDVLVIDPDVVLLRSPIGFFETLPLCDAYFHLDTKTEFDEDAFRRAGGYAKSDEGVTNFFNTGFMLLRGSEGGRRMVKSFVEFAKGYYGENAGERALDDQNVFVHWVEEMYRYDAGSGVADGEYAAGRLKCNECVEYMRRERAGLRAGRTREGQREGQIAGPRAEFSIYPLTPAIFPNRPIYEETEQHKKVNMLPFMVHVNWIQGLEKKKKWIQERAMWG